MRFIGLTGLALAAAGLAVSPARAQTQDDFFDNTYVHEIRLTVKPSDWDLLRKNYLDNTYYPADVHWNFKGKDVVIRDCAIRSRGHGSRSPVKPNLRVDLNRDNPDQKFLGLTSFILKANNQDPSMMAEVTVFRLFERLGLPASREAFTRVYINDVFWGAYLVEEEIRTEYTQRYLNESGGDLYEWKPMGTGEGYPDGYHWEWTPTCKGTGVACSTDPAKWNPVPWNPEENKNTFDLTPTINLHRMANQVADADFEKTIGAMLDLKLFLLHNAIESYVSDFDSFLGDAFGINNVWIYRYKGTSFHQFLLWDKDGAYSLWDTKSPYRGADRPLLRNTDVNVLTKRAMANPSRYNEFLEALYKTAVLAGGSGGWLEWEQQRHYNIARDAIREDTRKQWGDAGVEKDSNNDLFEARVAQNAGFIRDRYRFATDELARLGLQYPSAVFISNGGAVNAATNLGNVAPGSLVSLYGSGFSDGLIEAGTVPWPATLGGVSVYVNGFAAPIQFVSPGQINVQVPWEAGIGDGTVPFTVMRSGPAAKGTRAGSPANGTFTNTVRARMAPASPGIHAIAVAGGAAKAGDVVVIYASGLGAVTDTPATGAAAPPDKLVRCRETPGVTIGGQPAEVQFAGLAPGFVGAYQVNAVVPAGLPAGQARVTISAGGEVSQSYPIAIQ